MKKPESGNRCTGLLTLMLLLFFVFYTAMDKNRGVNGAAPKIPSVFVMVEGDVKAPGIYSIKHMGDLPELLGETAADRNIDISSANGESEPESGTSIKVIKKDNEFCLEKGEMSGFYKVTLGIPVNINKESVDGLTAIPGIGNSLARTIREERTKRKGFRDINELKSLPGIGDKLLAKITPYIRL